jgi:hypothetical protein
VRDSIRSEEMAAALLFGRRCAYATPPSLTPRSYLLLGTTRTRPSIAVGSLVRDSGGGSAPSA